MKNRNQIVLGGLLLLLFSIKNMGQEVGLPSFGSFTPMHTNSYRNMLVSNFNAFRFEYAVQKLGINPRNHQELQAIRYYPETVAWLNASNNQYNNINQLGIQIMPAEAYEKWLGTLKETKHKQENDAVNARFKGEIGKTSKN